MGNFHSTVRPPFAYTVPTEVDAGGEAGSRTAVYRCASHPDELVFDLKDETVETGWDIFLRGYAISGKYNFLGQRQVEDGVLGDSFQWWSYDDVLCMAVSVVIELEKRQLVPVIPFPEEMYVHAQQMKLLGIMSKNRMEWFVTEQVANLAGYTLLPLYDTLGDEATLYILKTTQVQTTIANAESAMKLMSLPDICALKTLILLDELTPELRDKAAARNLELIEYSTLTQNVDKYRHGHENTQRRMSSGLISQPNLDMVEKTNSHVAAMLKTHLPGIKIQRPKAHSVNTLCYTSGTTGLPKGVIVTHRMIAAVICAAIRGPLNNPRLNLNHTEIHISYLPLAHVFERAICNIMISQGASIGSYSGDPQKLLDDLKILKPSIFISVPRLFMRINDKLEMGLKEKSALAQFLFETGLNSKLDKLQRKCEVTDFLWDQLIFSRTKAMLGGNVKYMLSGSAPLDSSVQDKMSAIFCAWLLEGYGLTETLGATCLRLPGDSHSGHIGGPIPCNEMCLESVPEMNYFVTDDPPRGELMLRGHSLFPGYFLDPAQSKEAVAADGWLKTGDIAALLPGGAIKIVDRRKNIFKLSQGEYIAPEKIEAVVGLAPLVGQVFVTGRTTMPYIIAIVVPYDELAEKWKATKAGKEKLTLDQLCSDPLFTQTVLDQIQEAAKEGGLKGFEKPQKIVLLSEPFSVENGLLTSTFKIKRHFAKQYFSSQIELLYTDTQ